MYGLKHRVHFLKKPEQFGGLGRLLAGVLTQEALERILETLNLDEEISSFSLTLNKLGISFHHERRPP